MKKQYFIEIRTRAWEIVTKTEKCDYETAKKLFNQTAKTTDLNKNVVIMWDFDPVYSNNAICKITM